MHALEMFVHTAHFLFDQKLFSLSQVKFNDFKLQILHTTLLQYFDMKLIQLVGIEAVGKLRSFCHLVFCMTSLC